MPESTVMDPICRSSIVSRDQIRNQILDRLWQLANLTPEATRSSIAGQIKAMSMIVAIEGLIPNRRATAPMDPAAPPPKAQIYIGKPYRQHQHQHQHQDDDTKPENHATIDEGPPAAPQAPEPQPLGTPHQAPPPQAESNYPINPFVRPEPLSRTPEATGFAYDAIVNPAGPLRLSMSLQKGLFNRGRSNR